MNKTTRLCLKIVEAILYFFAGAMLFKSFHILSADLQDFSHQWRVLPIEVGYLLPFYWLILLHLLLYPRNNVKFYRTGFVNGIILTSLGAIGILVTSIYWGCGVYFFGDRSFSVIFPLELYLFYLSSILLGVYLFLYVRKNKDAEREYFPFVGNKAHYVFASILRPLFIVFSCYFSGALLDGLFQNYLNASSISYWEVYAIIIWNFLALGYYEFVLTNKGEIKINLSTKAKKIISIANFLLVTSLMVACFLLNILNPYYVAENFQMWIPLDFMGSFEFFLYLICFPLFGYSLYFLIHAFRQKQTA
jgi:hypothetical protein